MATILVKIAFAFTLAFTSACAAVNTPENDAGPAAIENNLPPVHYLEGHIDRRSIPEVMLDDNIPGISMVFFDNGTVAWKKVYGYANLGNGENVTPETVFAGASLSKPITAMTALALVNKGVLSLDEDVNHTLVSWKIPQNEFTETEKVTLRRLIGHTAGVKNHLWSSYKEGDPVPTTTEMLAGKAPSIDPAIELNSKPGERYKYSNPGYAIIQQLIEDVTGKSFNAAIEEYVFAPAQMRSSSFIQPIPNELRQKMATGYSKQLAPYSYKVFPFKAAGGIWTTPTDLGRFAITLMADYHDETNEILSKDLAGQVFAPTQARLGFTKRFSEGGNNLLFEHWGSNAGFTSYMVGSLDKKQVLVVMTNSDNGFDLMAAIARSVAQEYDWVELKPTVFTPITLTPEAMAQFVGKFGDGQEGGQPIKFTLKDGALGVTVNPAEAPQELVAVSENKFILPAENTTYEFLKDKADAIKWVRVTLASGYNFDLPKNEELSDFINRKMSETGVPGLAIAVIRDGKISYQENFGVTNTSTGAKVRGETLFEAASLSKPVFAYFVMKQVAKGVIDLDRPLYEYLPHPDLDHDPRHKLITARMILTHTSGLINWRADTGGELKILFTPGTDFQYSGEGYEYLRAVLQHVLKTDDGGLQILFQKEVVDPIGAQFMKYTWDDIIPGIKAFGHRNGESTDNDRHDKNFGAAYSLHTTASDYAKFVVALLQAEGTEKDIVSELLTLQTAMPREEGELPRSFGFPVKQTEEGLRYFHSGNNGDFRAYVHFYRESGNGIVLMSNSDNLFSSDLAKDIVEFLGEKWFYLK